MKRHFMVILSSCASIIFLIVGCSTVKANPKNVLSKYLDNHLYGKDEEAYQYISEKDKAVITLQEYAVHQAREDDNPFLRSFVEKVSYQIKAITTDGNRAKAKVDIISPDFEYMLSDIIKDSFLSVFGGEDDDEYIWKAMAERYKDKDIPMETTTRSYELVKESEGWKVFLNLKKEKKVQALLDEAEKLKKEKKLKGALGKYEEILELGGDEVTAKIEKKMKEVEIEKVETEKEIAGFEKKRAYIHNVKLYDFTAKYFSDYSDRKIPGVRFKIKNAGNKTLTKVEVAVYFKDSNGDVIAEEDYNPVLVSDFSYGDNKPLKPNYIWQMEPGNFYKAKSVPSEWQEGSAVAKITDIKFEE